MATYNISVKMKNGRTLMIFAAGSDAVGKQLNVSVRGLGSATTPTDFTVPQGEVWEVADISNGGDDTGMIDFTSDGESKGRYINLADHNATAIRPPVNITFVPGKRYRAEVLATLKA